VVVPIHDAAGTPIGVLDIDSHREKHFDAVDRAGYENVVKLLEEAWNKKPGRS
jgi:putative methionine-R-sulfoxide reductase with GAF domain